MKTEEENWTEIIKHNDSIFSINFKELFRYRDLLFMLVKRDFVTFYKQTILGPLWFILQPIIMTLTYVVIFGNIAGIKTDGTPKFIFYLAGITLWSYFSESLNKVSTVFKDNAAILGKVYFPRLIMPISIVSSSLIKLAIQLTIFIIFYSLQNTDSKIHLTWWILAIPYLILLLIILSLGIGMIISSLTTKYKDLIFLITFGIQLLMFVSPVLYPVSILPNNLKLYFSLNPLTGIFECFRYAFFGNGFFDYKQLILSSITSFFLLIVGTVIFNKVEKDFIDTV